jgi:hypothetical protein
VSHPLAEAVEYDVAQKLGFLHSDFVTYFARIIGIDELREVVSGSIFIRIFPFEGLACLLGQLGHAQVRNPVKLSCLLFVHFPQTVKKKYLLRKNIRCFKSS